MTNFHYALDSDELSLERNDAHVLTVLASILHAPCTNIYVPLPFSQVNQDQTPL